MTSKIASKVVELGVPTKRELVSSLGCRLLKLPLLLLSSFCFQTVSLVAQNETLTKFTTVVQELSAAQKKANSDPSMENRVRLATWRLLIAELATEHDDTFSLWSSATDQFAQGLDELDQIEQTIEETPALEESISETPSVAMRLDAARVRRSVIQQRAQLSRDAERERLNQLRTIAREYRNLLTKIAEADLYLRLEDYGRVRTNNAEVLNSINLIQKIAKSRKDYHLFDDEPELREDADFNVVQSLPAPFNVELIAHLKAIQALVSCRLALNGDSPDEVLLNEALLWANAALKGDMVPGIELPEGHADNNPLGHYVLGIANDATGVKTTQENPASEVLHEKARSFFNEANKQLKLAFDLMSKADLGSGVLAGLPNEINDRLKSLESIAPFLNLSDTETLNGRPQASWEILRDATKRHRDPDLWIAQLEAGRRARVKTVDLKLTADNAVQSKIFNDNDSTTQVVLMKVATDNIWEEIGKQGIAKVDPKRRNEFVESLSKQSNLLRTVLASEQNDALRYQGQAFLSLAIAYQALLSTNPSESPDALREGHRLARDSMVALELALTRAEGMEAVSLREALIASRLSYGHISMIVLPNYRDDAILSFAAAFDEMAKLPFRKGDEASLGSPLINALASRSEDSGTKLVFEERRYRELVTRFIEGMYAMQFGNAGAAADQMATALSFKQSTGEENQLASRDAGVMLGQTDGFDAQVTLQDSVRAFKVLAEIKAGRSEIALVESLRLLLPNSQTNRAVDVKEAELNDAIDKIQSPLVGFALASALEANLKTIDLDNTELRMVLLASTSAAFSRVEQQLKSPRMEARYPHLVSLVADTRKQLDSTDGFLEKANRLRASGDLKGAANTLLEGLRFHPQSEILWKLYLENQIVLAQRGDATENSFNQLLIRVDRARSLNMITLFQKHFYSAVLHERLGDAHASLAEYDAAVAAADNSRDRVLARSKISQLRIRDASRN
jgi:hypothetical protein